LPTWLTLSRPVNVSVGISKLGLTDLIVGNPRVKINGDHYCDVFLAQQLLPGMRDVSGDLFIFQQDIARTHRARDTAISWAVNTRFYSSTSVAPE